MFDYERRDISVRGLLTLAAGLLVCLTVTSRVLIRLHDGWHRHSLLEISNTRFGPAPVSEERLHSYGWIDRERGLIHIPIEDAMRIVVRRGGPDVQTNPGAGSTPDAGAAAGESSDGTISGGEIRATPRPADSPTPEASRRAGPTR